MSRSGSTAVFYTVKSMMLPSTITYFEPEPNLFDKECFPAEVLAKVIVDKLDFSFVQALVKKFDQVILLVRDPRDRLVSSMLFAMHGVDYQHLQKRMEQLELKRQSPRDISFIDLVERIFPQWTRQATVDICQHTVALFSRLNSLDISLQVVRYEDYIVEGMQGLSRLLSLQEQPANELPEKHGYGKRRVTPGDWKNWFTQEDVAFFKPLLDPFLLDFDYSDDWLINENPSIPARHSTDFVWAAYEKDQALKSRGINWRSDQN